MSHALLANYEHALEVLAREELGLDPADLGSLLPAAASWIGGGAGVAAWALGKILGASLG
ncbi:MAG TPA: hypothetical protein VFO82_04180 [Steroidobacteraceae bacterium]|nr:hypothetical protein [Steroidobacteraceae bacterium]